MMALPLGLAARRVLPPHLGALLLACVLLLPLDHARGDEHVWPVGERPPIRHSALETVQYGVTLLSASGHTAKVTMRIAGYDPGQPLEIAMPGWAPGAYRMIVPAKNVSRLSASAGGGSALKITRIDKQTWRIERPPSGGTIEVSYHVYHPKASVVRSHIAADYAGINGFDTFMYVVGNIPTACQVSLTPRKGWTLATALKPAGDHRYSARDYDVLIDTPILWGDLRTRSFTVAGRRHHLVWSGKNDYDLDRMASDTKAIVEAVHPMFDGPLPYNDYWFLWRFERGAGGGLEHLSSTRINDGPKGYRDPDELDRHHRVTAHEFVHTWNVKRIRPKSLGPFDYRTEQYTPYLWFAEGFTSYLGDLALLRAGIWTRDRYLRSLAAAIQAYRNSPARDWMSPEESSRTTWHKADNGVEGRINYYTAGQLIALCLDLELRRRTAGKKTLTTVMRAMYSDFRNTGRAFDYGAVQRTVERVAGGSFATFFDRHVRGVEELPFDRALGAVGLKLGRKPGRTVAWLGIENAPGPEARVTRVLPHSPARRAKLEVGDIIVAVGKDRVTGRNVGPTVRRFRPKETVELSFFRGGQLRSVRVRLGDRVEVNEPKVRRSFKEVRLRIRPARKASRSQRAERERWLEISGGTPTPGP